MTVYCVNYDLRKSDDSYPGLIAALKKYAAVSGGKPLKSTWMINTADTPDQIFNAMAPHLDTNDGVLIVQANAPAKWYGLPDGWTEWLKSNLR